MQFPTPNHIDQVKRKEKLKDAIDSVSRGIPDRLRNIPKGKEKTFDVKNEVDYINSLGGDATSLYNQIVEALQEEDWNASFDPEKKELTISRA